MNDPEARPDEKRPDQPDRAAGHPAPLPELVFRPDGRQAVRVARVRTFVALVTAAMMVGALILIVTYRSRPPAPSILTKESRAVLPAESATPAPAPAAIQPPPVHRETGVVWAAKSAAATVDTLVSKAAEKWLRATELTPQSDVTRENGEDAAAKLRKAVILADSARQDITLARQQAEVVFRASREAESGISFRLSVLYAAVDRYVKSIADDADDRYFFYSKSEASVRAVLLGDKAESEIQQNVAMSYLRRSEERQNSIRRLAQQVREALRNIDNVGR